VSFHIIIKRWSRIGRVKSKDPTSCDDRRDRKSFTDKHLRDSGRLDSNQRPLDPQATLNERDNPQKRVLKAVRPVAEYSKHSQNG
jgi:hypothetical protein